MGCIQLKNRDQQLSTTQQPEHEGECRASLHNLDGLTCSENAKTDGTCTDRVPDAPSSSGCTRHAAVQVGIAIGVPLQVRCRRRSSGGTRTQSSHSPPTKRKIHTR